MVGKKIRAYREFRGYSQIQLAELSGINVGTIRLCYRHVRQGRRGAPV